MVEYVILIHGEQAIEYISVEIISTEMSRTKLKEGSVFITTLGYNLERWSIRETIRSKTYN